MNLEEIKEWREQNNVEFDDEGMVLRSVDWLIAEVDRLSGSELAWYAKGQDDAAERCAEVAEKHGCSQCMGIGSRCCADAIREEFKAEE